MEISVFNDYGFVGGGFIYDQLDKLALYWLLKHRKNLREYNFTHIGFIKYHKQLCHPTFKIGVNWIKKIPFTQIYFIKTYMKNEYDVKVATGYFKFVGVNKNYCERNV